MSIRPRPQNRARPCHARVLALSSDLVSSYRGNLWSDERSTRADNRWLLAVWPRIEDASFTLDGGDEWVRHGACRGAYRHYSLVLKTVIFRTSRLFAEVKRLLNGLFSQIANQMRYRHA